MLYVNFVQYKKTLHIANRAEIEHSPNVPATSLPGLSKSKLNYAHSHIAPELFLVWHPRPVTVTNSDVIPTCTFCCPETPLELKKS